MKSTIQFEKPSTYYEIHEPLGHTLAGDDGDGVEGMDELEGWVLGHHGVSKGKGVVKLLAVYNDIGSVILGRGG